MAYVLGIVATDGSLDDDGFCISSAEASYLECIGACLCPGRPLVAIRSGYSAGGVIYQLRFHSQEMRDDLVALGLHPNKSADLRWPDVPATYLADFVRGVIDGDGSIMLRTDYTGRKDLKISLKVGSRPFASGFARAVSSLTGYPLHHVRETRHRDRPGTYFYVVISWREAVALCQAMYADPTALRLERKWAVYNEFVTTHLLRTRRRRARIHPSQSYEQIAQDHHHVSNSSQHGDTVLNVKHQLTWPFLDEMCYLKL